jgi:hypothetical protein
MIVEVVFFFDDRARKYCTNRAVSRGTTRAQFVRMKGAGAWFKRNSVPASESWPVSARIEEGRTLKRV